MRPATTDTSKHNRLTADLEAHARADERIRAAWLEGSFATGTADAGSDLDLHLAVTDEDFEAFSEQTVDWIAAARTVIGVVPLTLGARRLFACSLDDGLRLDLFVEPASAVAAPVRPVEPQTLFDRDDLLAAVQVDASAALSPVPRLREVLGLYLYGFTFPARLSAREEWGSLHLNALLVLYQFVVPAMLARSHPEHAFRQHLHNERFLEPDQRARVDAISVQLARAFASAPPDLEAVRVAYQTLFSTLLAELRAAIELHGITWPAEAEVTIRQFLADELNVELD